MWGERIFFVLVLLFLAVSLFSMPVNSENSRIDARKIDSALMQEMKNPSKKMVEVVISLNDEKKEIKNVLGKITKTVSSKKYISDSVRGLKGEVVHEFSSINAVIVKVPVDTVGELSVNPDIKLISKPVDKNIFLEESVPHINANDTWTRTLNGVNITGAGQTVCILDMGVDYTHPDLGNCTIVYHTYNGNTQAYSKESSHPYTNDGIEAYNITVENFTSIAVHFSNITMETEWDYVKVYDGNYTLVAAYTGSHTDVWSPAVPGDTIYVHTVSDEATVDYGFVIDEVINGSVNTTINWSSCNRIIGGWDMINSDADPMDDQGHGTHVAGIVGANGSLMGVAPDVNIVAVKVCKPPTSCPGTADLQGMDWCINKSEEYNISVISMSLGGGQFTSYCDTTASWIVPYAEMANAALEKNISVVIATGNNVSLPGIAFPSCITNATKVSNTDDNDVFVSSAQRHPNFPEIVTAPGYYINSTQWGGGYVEMSGTSMATPHVSGTIALINQLYLYYHGSLPNPLLVRQRLNDTGVPIDDSGTVYYRIDTDAAIQSFIPPQITVETPLNSTIHPKHVDFNITADKALNKSWLKVDSESLVYLSNDTAYHWYYTAYNDLLNGLHNATFTANDTWGNINQTTVWFYADSYDPNITIYYPWYEVVLKNESIDLNYTAIDSPAGIDSCWYSLDGEANQTIPSCANTTFNVSIEGEHNITIYSNDSVGNLGSNTTLFNITLDPVVVITNPVNNTYYGYTNITFNFTYQSNFPNDTCWYNLNDNITNTTINCSNGTLINASQGLNNITLWANNTHGKTGSDVVFFTADTIFPLVGFIGPTPNSSELTNASNFTVNISHYDARPDMLLFFINSELNQSISDPGNYTNFTLNLSDGFYEYYAVSNDTANNTNQTEIRNITIDTEWPSITDVSMFPQLLFADENLTWAAVFLDTVNLSSAWCDILNSTNDTVYTKAFNNTMGLRNESYNTTSLETGYYEIYLYTNDTINHTTGEHAGYFEIADSIKVSIDVLNATGNSTNATLRLYYNGTNSQRSSAENETLNSTIPEGLWKLVLESIGLNITMDNVNITNITRLGNVSFNDNISTSSISASAVNAILRALKKIVSAETTFNFTIGQVVFSYDDTGMNENYMSVWACHSWNLSTEFCNGTWDNVTSNSTINTTSNVVEVNTTRFSAFTLAQDKYCGDGICDSVIEDCSSCSTDCGTCITNPPAGGSPGGGGAPPSKTKKMEIITTNETLNATIQKAISIPLKNTGETNLTNVTVALESDCLNCSFSKTLFISDRINVNDSVLISFSALFNEEGTYYIILTGNSSEGATLNAFVTITVEKYVQPESVPSCNYNKVCEPELGEDKARCSDDCSKPEVCIQVITPAKNPETGECIEYPTPCDVPEGWVKVDSCEQKPAETVNDYDYTILYLILAVAIMIVAVSIIIKIRHGRNIIVTNNPFS